MTSRALRFELNLLHCVAAEVHGSPEVAAENAQAICIPRMASIYCVVNDGQTYGQTYAGKRHASNCEGLHTLREQSKPRLPDATQTLAPRKYLQNHRQAFQQVPRDVAQIRSLPDQSCQR